MEKEKIYEFILTNFSANGQLQTKAYLQWAKDEKIFPDSVYSLDKYKFIQNSYNYLHNIDTPKCKNPLCNNDVNINTFKAGYKTKYCSADCWRSHRQLIYKESHKGLDKNEIIDYKKLEDKDELYNFILTNIAHIKNSHINDKNVILRNWLKKYKLDVLIDIYHDNMTMQDLYDYFNDKKLSKCPICDIDLKFISFTYGYPKYCSNLCYKKGMSISRMGDKNPIHKMSNKTKENMKKTVSMKLKQLIKDGKFTPNITNSWAKSKTKISLDDKIVSYRSTWEAYFQLKNPTFIYEKIRIPYVHDGITHSYIVDFVDINNKTIYEIKPSKIRDDENKNEIIKIKEKYAIEWCKTNKYDYKLITEDWFYDNYDDNLIINQPDYEKMKRNLKQFLGKKDENKKN